MADWNQPELFRVIAASESRVAELTSSLNKAPVSFAPGYVSQHDVVYLRKNEDWYQGLPFGNGSIGGVVCYGNDLTVHLDKTDLWQDVASQLHDEDGKERKHGGRGGRIHAGALIISFEGQALTDGVVEQRIDLLRGRITVLHQDADRELRAAISAHAETNCILVEIGHPADITPIVRLENFAYDNKGEGEDDCWIQRSLGHQQYRVLCRKVESDEARTVFKITIVTRTENGADLVSAADDLVEKKWDQESHDSWWADFWNRSYVCIPDKFIENEWYLAHYITAATNRASIPASFYGLWDFENPIRQWGDMFITDAQHPLSYWSVLTSNHAELLGPYLELYRDLQPHFERAAVERLPSGSGREPLPGTRKVFIKPGEANKGMAFAKSFCPPWAGLWHEKYGLPHTVGPSKGEKFNTTGGWIAQLFWQYYRHSGDRQFLADMAYPFMRSALRYIIGTLSRDAAGRIYNTSESPEQHKQRGNNNSSFGRALTWQLLKDTIEASLILKTDEGERETWKEIYENLAPYPMARDGAIAESSLQDHPFRAHLSVLAGVYPTCEIDADHALATAAAATLEKATRFYAKRGSEHRGPVLAENEGGGELNVFFSTHASLCFVRLGMGDQVIERLYNPVFRYLLYPHGGWAHNPGYHIQGPAESTGLPVVPQIVNEMLLQLRRDHDLYLFPALPKQWGDALFRNLRIEGGFVVSAELAKSSCLWVQIISLSGEMIRLRNPFDGAYRVDSSKASVTVDDAGWITLSLQKGECILLVAANVELTDRTLTSAPAAGPRCFDKDEIARKWPVAVVPEDPPTVYQDFGDRKCYIGMPAPGNETRSAVPNYEKILAAAENKNWNIRQRSAVKLRGAVSLGPDQRRRAIDALLLLLWDPEPPVRVTALSSLAAFGDDKRAVEGIDWAHRIYLKKDSS